VGAGVASIPVPVVGGPFGVVEASVEFGDDIELPEFVEEVVPDEVELGLELDDGEAVVVPWSLVGEVPLLPSEDDELPFVPIEDVPFVPVEDDDVPFAPIEEDDVPFAPIEEDDVPFVPNEDDDEAPRPRAVLVCVSMEPDCVRLCWPWNWRSAFFVCGPMMPSTWMS
jgi:hypothetical protein